MAHGVQAPLHPRELRVRPPAPLLVIPGESHFGTPVGETGGVLLGGLVGDPTAAGVGAAGHEVVGFARVGDAETEPAGGFVRGHGGRGWGKKGVEGCKERVAFKKKRKSSRRCVVKNTMTGDVNYEGLQVCITEPAPRSPSRVGDALFLILDQERSTPPLINNYNYNL